MHKKNIPAFVLGLVGVVAGVMIYINTGESKTDTPPSAEVVAPPSMDISTVKLADLTNYQVVLRAYFDRLKLAQHDGSFYRLYESINSEDLHNELVWFVPNIHVLEFKQYDTDQSTMLISLDRDTYIIAPKGAIADLRYILGQLTSVHTRLSDDNDFKSAIILVLGSFYSGVLAGAQPYFRAAQLQQIESIADMTLSWFEQSDYHATYAQLGGDNPTADIPPMLAAVSEQILTQVNDTNAQLVGRGVELATGSDYEVGYRSYSQKWYTDWTSDFNQTDVIVHTNIQDLWSTVDLDAFLTNPILFGGAHRDHAMGDDTTVNGTDSNFHAHLSGLALVQTKAQEQEAARQADELEVTVEDTND